MSFVNVGVLGASAAPAVAGSISAAPSAQAPTARYRENPFLAGIMVLFPLDSILGSNGHFHVGIGPAALETGAAFARLIVGLHTQRVIAWRVERRRRRNHVALFHDQHPRP